MRSKCFKDKYSADISLNIQGQLQQNKQIVTEEFACYFSTIILQTILEEWRHHAWLKKSVKDTLEWVAIRHRQMPSTFNLGALAETKFWMSFGGVVLRDPQWGPCCGISMRMICSVHLFADDHQLYYALALHVMTGFTCALKVLESKNKNSRP